jgi:two-component system response regulator HydG
MEKKENPQLLLIEDDIDTQELMTAFFKPKGFGVAVYDDAEKALIDFEKGLVNPDIVVTDLMLPNLSGMDLIKRMHGLRQELPIILMTSHKSVEIAVEAIQAGAYDFVVKPLHFPQLLISVQRALYLSQVQAQNSTLKTIIQTQEVKNVDGIIGKSPGFRKALDIAKRVADSSANVLITGESGTGKEIIAKAIHNSGSRAKLPFIPINCSAIPENLLESELFGHAKGAFTGANDKKIGLFEEAEGGTLFLDEIGDLNPTLQAKLLRVLQERKIKRIGENQYRPVNARIVSATHKDLKREVFDKRFREDLFFRLNVIPVDIPPLRDRKEDIIPLAEFFLKKYSTLNNRNSKGFAKEALQHLLSQSWPGNVRELENTIERAVVLAGKPEIQTEDLQSISYERSEMEAAESDSEFDFNFDKMKNKGQKVLPIEEITQRYIQYVLQVNKGAKDKTAKDLGIDRKTLYRKLHMIEQPGRSESELN